MRKFYYDELINPDDVYMSIVAKYIFNLFEEELDQAYETDFYETYFSIKTSDDFYEVKLKLQWFAFHSYLLGFEFSDQLVEQQQEVRGELLEEEDIDFEYFQLATITLVEHLSFKTLSRWAGMSALEWFSEIARADDACKKQLLGLGVRHMGKYVFNGEVDSDHYLFQHLYSRQEYHVPMRGFSQELNLDKGIACMACFLLWGDQWVLSGITMRLGMNNAMIREYQEKGEPQLYDYVESYRKKVLEAQMKLEETFRSFFKDHLVIMESEEALKGSLKEYYRFHQKEVNSGKKLFVVKEEPELQFAPDYDGDVEGVAIYERKGKLEFVEDIKRFIQIACMDEEPDREERLFLEDYVVFSDFSAPFFIELNKRYDLKNLHAAFNVPKAIFDMNPDQMLSYYLRFLKPLDFKDDMPGQP